MTTVAGTCDDRFTAVKEAFATNFDEGLDVGASVAVVSDGEMVVDLWGGFADEAKTTPWERDTIINVWSTTKTMTFLSALILADRGELDFHTPVAKYWPEFAANGKEGVEVRHLMGHTAGLSGWQEPISATDLEDWEKCTSLLAAQAPWWEPGTASGYHAVTQGYLVGEVVRRISGSSIGAFFAKEIAGPLGADFHIGTGPENDDRIALVIPPVAGLPPDLDPNGIPARTFANPPMQAEMAHTIGWRRAEIPAANGHGNARSVARAQAVVSHGGELDGTLFLSEAGCRAIFEEQANGTDLVLQMPTRLGMGYGLNSDAMPISPNANACYWGGWGGSIVVNDLDARLTVSYVMNRMGEGTTGDLRGAMLVLAAYASLAAA
jgi:CubicO group peptidase (beta-lactamase class C family)